MNMLIAWLRQPSSVAGISTIVGTAMGVLTGTVTWQIGVPLLAGALAAIVLPDNAGAKTTIEHATADLIAAEQAVIKTSGMATVVTGSPTKAG